MRNASQGLVSVVVAIFVLSVQVEQSESTSLSSYVKEIKSYLVDKAKMGLISRSTMLTSFQDAMNMVEKRFSEAKAEGKLVGKDDQEAQVLYYSLVIEEIRNLRVRIESDKTGELGKIIGQAAPVDLPKEIENLSEAKSCDISNLPDGADPSVLDMDMDLDGSNEEDWVLVNEMDDIERQWLSEAEYGVGMTEEDLKNLKLRTQLFIRDLMTNELHQLATAILSAYMSGCPVLPVAIAVLANAKHKFFDYFLNCVMDILTIVLGRRPDIVTPENLVVVNKPALDDQLLESSDI